jgi:membrane-associated phospholipid phosphatase
VGIDFIRFACPLIGSPLLEWVLQVLNLLAHGLAAAAVGLALLAAGLATRNRRFVRVGLAVLLAAALAGLAANGLKLLFRVPRPHPMDSYSFPSGHSTTAFAVAAVLARAFPPAGPIFAFVALFGGLARVYFRDHFLIDVVAGGLLGVVIGLAVAPRFLGSEAETGTSGRGKAWAWLLLAAVAVPAISWFAVYERELDTHLRKPTLTEDPRPLNVAVRFGTPGARGLLRSGWSDDEKWNGAFPFVWAEGTDSRVSIPPLLFGDYNARLRVNPLVRGEGLACQVVDVSFNGTRVGRVLLDRGWNDYEVAIPRRLVRPSGANNEMGFRFAYAMVPNDRDPRRLAVAFRSVEIRADGAGVAPPAR